MSAPVPRHHMPAAWLVRDAQHGPSVHLDFGRAVAYAAARRGTVVPLYEHPPARAADEPPFVDTVIEEHP